MHDLIYLNVRKSCPNRDLNQGPLAYLRSTVLEISLGPVIVLVYITGLFEVLVKNVFDTSYRDSCFEEPEFICFCSKSLDFAL